MWEGWSIRVQLPPGTALKRVTTGQDIANTVLFMASDDARQITGQHIAVDGGWDV